MAYGFPNLLKFKDALVNVVRVVHWDVYLSIGLGRQILGGTSMTKVQAGTVETGGGPLGIRGGKEAVSSAEGCEGCSKTQGNRSGRRERGAGVTELRAATTTRAEAGGTREEETSTDGTDGATESARVDEKETGGANSHEVGWMVRWKNPREVSSVAVARTGTGGASAKREVAEEGGRPQRLAA